MQGKKIEAWFVSLVSRAFHGVELTTFLQQIAKKKQLKKYELLNMFFHMCSYKNSCFSELVYNSSVLVLMVYSYQDVLKDFALDFVGNFSFEGLLYFIYNFE